MKTYKGIIFDLDGTLLDNQDGDSTGPMLWRSWMERTISTISADTFDQKACKPSRCGMAAFVRKLIPSVRRCQRITNQSTKMNCLLMRQWINFLITSKAYQKRYWTVAKTILATGILYVESLEEKELKLQLISPWRGDYGISAGNETIFSQGSSVRDHNCSVWRTVKWRQSL